MVNVYLDDNGFLSVTQISQRKTARISLFFGRGREIVFRQRQFDAGPFQVWHIDFS